MRHAPAGKLSTTNLHNPITGREQQYIPEIKTMPGRHLSYQGLPKNLPNVSQYDGTGPIPSDIKKTLPIEGQRRGGMEEEEAVQMRTSAHTRSQMIKPSDIMA